MLNDRGVWTSRGVIVLRSLVLERYTAVEVHVYHTSRFYFQCICALVVMHHNSLLCCL